MQNEGGRWPAGGRVKSEAGRGTGRGSYRGGPAAIALGEIKDWKKRRSSKFLYHCSCILYPQLLSSFSHCKRQLPTDAVA